MIIIINDDVFAAALNDSAGHLALMSLIQLGAAGRHRIELDPLFEPGADRQVNAWLHELGRLSRSAVDNALEFGSESSVGFSWKLEVKIRVEDVAEPDWHASPPVLPLTTALSLAQQPLRVMVENSRNDGAFLRRMCRDIHRDVFLRALGKGWIAIDQGGGIGELKKRIQTLQSRGDSLRLWSMFDSDARQPGAISKQSRETGHACENAGIPYHRLARRAIENYLPLKALEKYFDQTELAGAQYIFKSFSRMAPSQRYFYNMKKGFRGDRAGGNAVPDFFGAHGDVDALQQGIHKDVWEYICSYIDQHWKSSESNGEVSFERVWLDDKQEAEDNALDEASRMIRRLLQRL